MPTGAYTRSEPPASSPPTRRFVRLLREHAALFRLQEIAVAHDRGLSTAQLRCLAEFEGAPELTAKALTHRLGLSHSRLSHVLESLEGNEMISRRISPDDRRIIVVDLSPKGRAVVEALEAGLICHYESALRATSREASETTLTVLARMLEAARPGLHELSSGTS